VLVVVSGARGVGKTTLCRNAAQQVRQRGYGVSGLLALPVMQDGRKVGIRALDLASGEERLLARADRSPGGVVIGPYSFDARAVAWAVEVCLRALRGDGIAFIDEIGPLELDRGAGLAPVLPALSRPREAHTVVVVRTSLVDRFSSRVTPIVPRVVWVDPERRCRARRELEALLLASPSMGACAC